MAPGLIFAHQHFLEAAETMATAEGGLRERIALAWPAIEEVEPADFRPQRALGQRHAELLALLGIEPAARPSRGAGGGEAIAARLASASDEDVIAIADRIFALFLSLHRLRHGAAP